MAAPQPKAHRPQVQRMTVALRNICRDYPAGGGILRELLQNADDAGASSVRFVLDLRSHPTDDLLHPYLARYQGPALLAYNSAVFSEEDFGSLSRVGDSRKLQDGSTTGKFGRGFNSVYNWTDSPSIVSESTLLILDPHHGWSATFPNSIPGGPTYDFVATADNVAMKNQMSAFSAVMEEFDMPFNGTVIRIPLRTESQAKESEICGRPTTASDIEEVVKKFSSEFGSSGLLFMKNVESIKIEMGNDVPFHMEISNAADVRSKKRLINETLKTVSKGVGSSLDLSFDVDIESASLVGKSQTSFAVHHSIADYPTDEKLRGWCKAQAMVPWIAVAAKTPVDASEARSGSLFTVLPLQISTNQPVHIHGLFSLSTDRARLHHNSDSSVQDQLPAQWNEWLFQRPMPIAWVNLLLFLAERYRTTSAFARWPLTQDSLSGTPNGMIQKVLQIVQDKCSNLWYTDLGYTNANVGILANGDESATLRNALWSAQVPVIYLPDTLLSYVQGQNLLKRLSPISLCHHLERSTVRGQTLSEDAKQVLLEYILSDSSFRDYGRVELFPFEDGSYKPIENDPVFVHRDDEEQAVFNCSKYQNIDLQKLSWNTKVALRNGFVRSSLHPSLRQRSSSELKSYCLSTYFKNVDEAVDTVTLNEDAKAFVSRVWEWIVARGYNLSNTDLASLWLVPLSNGQYRKLKPKNPSSGTIYAPSEDMGDFLRKITNINAIKNKPIVLSNRFSSRVLQLFITASTDGHDLLIKNGGVLQDFVLWLKSISEVMEQASDGDKLRLQELLVSRRHLCRALPVISDALRGLKVFRKAAWPSQNDRQPSFSWTSLSGFSQVIGLRDYVPVPNRPDVLFLDAKSEMTTKLLTEYQLATCPSTLRLLEDRIIPYWESGILDSMSIPCREQITKLLLRHFYEFEKATCGRLGKLPFIPVVRIDNKSFAKFASATQLIDPSNHLLRNLFFDDEEVCPAEWVISDFKGVLIECGLQISLTEDLVRDRVKCFGDNSKRLELTWERGRTLLKATAEWTRCSSATTSVLRGLRWLPAIDPHGMKILSSATQCRGLDDELLVSLVLPVVNFHISKQWRERLGWNEPISHNILLSQLEKGILQENRDIVNAVLRYIQRTGQFEALHEALIKLRCVLTQNDCFVNPPKAFRTGCERLAPYLQNVGNSFWHDHGSLLARLGVKDHPDLECLFRIQKELHRKALLDETERGVAIEIINLTAAYDREQLSELMIVTTTGSLCAIEEITYNDLGLLSSVQGTVNYTHQDIPYRTIIKLRIEPLSERVKKRQLDLTDIDDEDEFDQREEVSTGIADTLDRYPVESTFKEYLANADDAESATEVNWLLDARQHPQVTLVTSELSAYQGASLIVHNDGIFLDKDFEGLKHVGRGSKGEDTSTIGKFGRGSQTMYHWTDVPMLLSGEYLLILDPLQQVLQMNYRKGHRKSGMKIKLSKLKTICPDQLAPFEGLYGYSQELDSYPGTIFRFPLRPPAVQSRLRESTTPLDYTAAQNHLGEFFDEARISLLFLRRVRLVDFRIQGEEHPRWSVKSSRGRLDSDFSDWTTCTVTKGNGQDVGTTEDRWWTAIQDPPDLPTEMLRRHKRRMKDVECGIAALVESSSGKAAKAFPAPKPRVFSTLPLPFPLELPVHIHATFLTTGDRQSIVIDSSAREAGADWNRWLLDSAIPSLYLAFLDDLARKIGQESFRFWPTKVKSKGSLSELIYTSFWQQLPESTYRLFPLARQLDSSKKRQLPRLLDIRDATFDFLDGDTSEILRDVLESQIPTLVRPPFEIRRKLESLEPKVKVVTTKRLRELCQSEMTAEYLVKSKYKDKIIDVLLKVIMPKSEHEFEELHGCRVLPLADGTVGVLNIKNPLKPTITYYLADKLEVALFDFALGLLTPEGQGTDFKRVLLDYKKFNIKQLDLTDMGMLLGKKDFLIDSAESTFDSWLRLFWRYWHKNEILDKESSETAFLSASGVRNYQLLKATHDDAQIYLKPSELGSLPSIIGPEDEQHQNLCGKFTGLYKLNSNYMPIYLKTAERSLKNPPSFARLIKSISMLAAKQSRGLESYIMSVLGTAEIKIFRELVRNYLELEPADQYAIKSTMQQLPIWPSTSLELTLLTASGATIAGDPSLLVPWMSGYTHFVQPTTVLHCKSALKSLGVPEIASTVMLKKHILPHLPHRITSQEEMSYKSFITAVSRVCTASHPRKFLKKDTKRYGGQEIIELLRNSRLALDGNGEFQKTNALFDHDDALFQAAFREEVTTRFLSPQARGNKQLWEDIGLRSKKNGNFAAEDYILCLQTMRRRLDASGARILDVQLASDFVAVLEPLTSSGTTFTSNFTGTDWRTIQMEAIFPVLAALVNEPSYRRDSMATLATSQPLLSLADIVNSRYIPICWSQTTFPSSQPSDRTFNEIATRGRPLATMVWKHLDHLVQSADSLTQSAIPDFLSDLTRTYDFLQENLDESCRAFNLATRPLWLNLEIADDNLIQLEDLRSSWFKTEHLVLLSTCDSPPLMSVQSRLMRHERLLKKLGCRTIIYPTIIAPNIGSVESLSASMARLRREGKMLDIKLTTEGKEVQAHKTVLAAASEFFALQFSGRWAYEASIPLAESFATLSTIVDFAYAELFDWTPLRVTEDDDIEVIANKLDSLLDLLTAANYFQMPGLHPQVEREILSAGRSFIRIENVLDIQARAAQAKATQVEKACVGFYEGNKVLVDCLYKERDA